MKPLEDVFSEIFALIESKKAVELKTKGRDPIEVFLEDFFIYDGVLKISYRLKGELMEIALTELESVDGLSIFEILGLNEGDFHLFEKERFGRGEEKPLVAQNRYSVKSLMRYLKEMIEGDVNLMEVCLRAEVANFSRSSQGHVYFSLKEDDVSIRCVFFKSRQRDDVQFGNGDLVEVIGDLKLYGAQSSYQITVQKATALGGEGIFYSQYRKLWGELQSLGFFEESRKKSIPKYPKKVALITSLEGAAIEDILKIWEGKNYFDAMIYPVAVQGKNAAKEMIEALGFANEDHETDVILLSRGGGSVEDLWCFNDRSLVEAVSYSRAPVVTAIGHEVDSSLCDYASSLRVPTPTAAAYYLLTHYEGLENYCQDLKEDIKEAFFWTLEETKGHFRNLKEALADGFKGEINRVKGDLEAKKAFLESLIPKNILEQGYAVVRDSFGKQIKRSKDAKDGVLTLEFSDGKLNVLLEAKKAKEVRRA